MATAQCDCGCGRFVNTGDPWYPYASRECYERDEQWRKQ